MSTPAPAKKKVGRPSAVTALMVEMGSTKGFDPMPPDQYLYFLGKKESPLQRLLALVRARTIAQGHRSAFCVDEKGKELRQADLRRELGMDWGNFRRVLKEATARGLIRVGDRHHRAHPHRVYLCGSVAESIGYEDCTKDALVRSDSNLITPGLQKALAGWPKEQQARFYAGLGPRVKLWHQRAADAQAAVRQQNNSEFDEYLAGFAEFGLPTRKTLPKRREDAGVVQLTFLRSPAGEFIQTESVATGAAESVPTRDSESVPAPASLLPSEKNREASPSASSSSSGSEPEGLMLMTDLSISEETADALLAKVRAVQPAATVRETWHLARLILEASPNVRSPVGLLLAKIHTYAGGPLFDRARDATAVEQYRREEVDFKTAGGG